MLPKEDRLTTGQFDLVMKKGRVFNSSLFLARVIVLPGKAKLAAVVPQKIAKTAVGRNKLRRSMYIAMEPYIDGIVDDRQAIIFAKSLAVGAEQSVLVKDMKEIFVKSGLLK